MCDYTLTHLSKFWGVALTKHILANKADFYDTYKSFLLKERIGKSRLGKYSLFAKSGAKKDEAKDSSQGTYRARHPVGQYVLAKALESNKKTGKVVFDISSYQGYKLSVVEQLKGQSGYLALYKLSVFTDAQKEQEDYLLFCGFTNKNKQLKPEVCRKLFDCIGYEENFSLKPEQIQKLYEEVQTYATGTLEDVNERHLVYVKEEEERLHKWAEDMVVSLEKELVNLKTQIRDTERMLRQAKSSEEHLELQTKLQKLNKRKRNARVELEDNEEAIYQKRQELIENIRKRVASQSKLEEIFSIAWEVV